MLTPLHRMRIIHSPIKAAEKIKNSGFAKFFNKHWLLSVFNRFIKPLILRIIFDISELL